MGCLFVFGLTGSVFEVDEVYDDFYHHVFLYRFAFGDHEGKGDEGVIGDLLRTVGPV
jgi:hypothetical protein